jgi:hypothetical protein
MVFGTVFNFFWAKSWIQGTGCYCKLLPSELAIASTFGIYVSYLILFCDFFYKRYIKNSTKKEKKE